MGKTQQRMRDGATSPEGPPPDAGSGGGAAVGLRIGDRMTRHEFHRRYNRVTDKTKWELIGGVVYMASPLHIPHGDVHAELIALLRTYKARTPGTRVHDNVTTQLSNDTEVQPDCVLRLEPALGGSSRAATDEQGSETFVDGPPELVVEIAHSSRAIDLHLKRDEYLAAGVAEYLVMLLAECELRAWNLIEDVALPVEPDGIWRSRRFPGLWIEPAAVFADDTAQSLEVLEQGLATEDHQRFVAHLQQLREKP